MIALAHSVAIVVVAAIRHPGSMAASIGLALLGLLLVVLGERAHGRAVKAGRKPPKLATITLTLGAFAAGAGLIDAAAHWAPWRVESTANEMWEGTRFQERVIYNACQAFLSVRGRLPGTLEDLVPDFLDDRRALSDPQHRDQGEIGYQYFGSGSTGQEPDTAIFLASKAELNGTRAVIFFDGKRGFVPSSELPVDR